MANAVKTFRKFLISNGEEYLTGLGANKKQANNILQQVRSTKNFNAKSINKIDNDSDRDLLNTAFEDFNNKVPKTISTTQTVPSTNSTLDPTKLDTTAEWEELGRSYAQKNGKPIKGKTPDSGYEIEGNEQYRELQQTREIAKAKEKKQFENLGGNDKLSLKDRLRYEQKESEILKDVQEQQKLGKLQLDQKNDFENNTATRQWYSQKAQEQGVDAAKKRLDQGGNGSYSNEADRAVITNNLKNEINNRITKNGIAEKTTSDGRIIKYDKAVESGFNNAMQEGAESISTGSIDKLTPRQRRKLKKRQEEIEQQKQTVVTGNEGPTIKEFMDRGMSYEEASATRQDWVNQINGGKPVKNVTVGEIKGTPKKRRTSIKRAKGEGQEVSSGQQLETGKSGGDLGLEGNAKRHLENRIRAHMKNVDVNNADQVSAFLGKQVSEEEIKNTKNIEKMMKERMDERIKSGPRFWDYVAGNPKTSAAVGGSLGLVGLAASTMGNGRKSNSQLYSSPI